SEASAVISVSVVSTLLKVASVVLVLPQASVAAHIPYTTLFRSQRSLKASKSLLQVTPLASVAVAPPLDSNQELSAAAFPFPSLSTELSEASAVISGSVVSTIVKVASVVLVLPQASVAVNIAVTATVPPPS